MSRIIVRYSDPSVLLTFRFLQRSGRNLPERCTIKLQSRAHLVTERCVQVLTRYENFPSIDVNVLCCIEPLFFMHHAVSETDILNRKDMELRRSMTDD